MPSPFDPRSWTRETRLLVVTIVLSVSVLLLLARFRFPSQQPLELPAQPLQRLAARAAFDDLSTEVRRTSERVRPSVFVVTLTPARREVVRSLTVADVLDPGGASSRQLAVAYQFRPDAALVLSTVPGVPGGQGARGTALLARDAVRGLSVLRTGAAAGDTQPLLTSNPAGPQYLLAADATPGGVALRPLFGVSADAFASPLWQQPLIGLGQQVQAAHGTLVFSMDGAFVGAVIDSPDGQAIVPADELVATADRLIAVPPRPPSTLGVRVQALDERLVRGTGATAGVVIASVEDGAPAAGVLAPGDVVTHVAGAAVTTPAGALRLMAALDTAAPTTLRVWRAGAAADLAVTARPLQPDEGPAPASDVLGLTLRRAPGGSLVVDVGSATAAAAAGVRAGDVITWAGGVDAPIPARVQSAWTALSQGASLLVSVERDGGPVMLALTRQ